MIGPFQKASEGYNHILVTIDKFTKWIEVKPIKMLTAAKAAGFIVEITHRFRVPSRIITDLGTNFTSWEFQDFCDEHNMKVRHASATHLRANSRVGQRSSVAGNKV